MIAAAKAYYEGAIARAPSGLDPNAAPSVSHRRPPDWSAAQVLRRPDGVRVVATILRGDAFRPAGDSLESLGAITFEVGANGAVNAGTVLEFVLSGPVRPSALAHYIAGYWRESFGNSHVVVAEFSMHYAPRGGREFRVGEEPRSIRIDAQTSGASKTHGSQAVTCYYYIVCYYDPDTGALLYCDGDSIRLLFCIGNDCEADCDDGGGGDDGDDEDECDCDNKEQCDLEDEYDDAVNWPCDKFHIVHEMFYKGDKGTHNGEHNGYGYIDPAMPAGYGAVVANFTQYHAHEGGFIISSTWRCPKGNSDVGGALKSPHLLGVAIDFTGYYNGAIWPTGHTDYKVRIGEWAMVNAGARFYDWYPTRTHLHLDWRH